MIVSGQDCSSQTALAAIQTLPSSTVAISTKRNVRMAMMSTPFPNTSKQLGAIPRIETTNSLALVYLPQMSGQVLIDL